MTKKIREKLGQPTEKKDRYCEPKFGGCGKYGYMRKKGCLYKRCKFFYIRGDWNPLRKGKDEQWEPEKLKKYCEKVLILFRNQHLEKHKKIKTNQIKTTSRSF